MTDIEQKALALLNEVRLERGKPFYASLARMGDDRVEALCRAIEAHEATKKELSDYKQKVSDAVEGFMIAFSNGAACLPSISHLVIPAPKPDPLVDIVEWLGGEWTPEEYAEEIRSALDARGFEIREKNDG